eukprot:322023-Prorocentrum_minimum.AAC.1
MRASRATVWTLRAAVWTLRAVMRTLRLRCGHRGLRCGRPKACAVRGVHVDINGFGVEISLSRSLKEIP